MRNFQRDGIRRVDVPRGQVAYDPNSLAPGGPREDPARGFTTFPAGEAGDREVGNKIRERSGTFADHYSQARLFWRSVSEPEQRHIINAFSFELGKVSTVAIRRGCSAISRTSIAICASGLRKRSAWRDRPTTLSPHGLRST